MKLPNDTFPDEVIRDNRVLAYWDEELECYIYYDPDFKKALDADPELLHKK